MRYGRVWTDEQGESHAEWLNPSFADVENYAQGVPAVGLTEPKPAGVTHMLRARAGWVGDWHPVPVRQLCVILQGRTGSCMSDGTETEFGPGDSCVLEDTWGKGHKSWVIGDEDLIVCMVTLPQET